VFVLFYVSHVDKESRAAVAALVNSRAVAALGTLQDGAPAVSMVPFVFLPKPGVFAIRVSELAAHTGNMRADKRISLMVMECEAEGRQPTGLPRLMVQGEATEVTSGSPLESTATSAYLQKFPEAEMTLGLADFAFFTIRPVTARFVGGFARAFDIDVDELPAALA
jgi:putative heme iron utilization protein